jgi:hypothetical protein
VKRRNEAGGRVAALPMLDAGCRIQDAGCRVATLPMQDAGYRILYHFYNLQILKSSNFQIVNR